MYTCAYLHVTTRKSSTITILLVTTRKFGWPACNSWPLIGRLTLVTPWFSSVKNLRVKF